MIEVNELSIQQGRLSLENVSFSVPSSQYAVMMGKTGCGKTTLIEAICGLRRVASGVIRLYGNEVTHLAPAARQVGYVPQDAALFDTMSVYDHLAFSLRIRRERREAIQERVEELAELLDITSLLHRFPKRLSGGEKQRVALGRALAFRPRTLLLDEPLSALDEATRYDMYELLRRVKQHTDVTAIHVTHSTSEAVSLADVVLRIEDGDVTTMSSSNLTQPPCPVPEDVSEDAN